MLVEHLYITLTPEQREEMLVLILKEQYKICSAFDDRRSMATCDAMIDVLEYNMTSLEFDNWAEEADKAWRDANER